MKIRRAQLYLSTVVSVSKIKRQSCKSLEALSSLVIGIKLIKWKLWAGFGLIYLFGEQECCPTDADQDQESGDEVVE